MLIIIEPGQVSRVWSRDMRAVAHMRVQSALIVSKMR